MTDGKRLASRSIFDGKVVKLSVDEVRLPNGLTTELEMIRHQGAAAAVPVDERGHFTVFMNGDQEAGVALMIQGVKLRDSPFSVGFAVVNAWTTEALALSGDSSSARKAVSEFKQLLKKSGASAGDIAYLRAQALLSIEGKSPNWKAAAGHMGNAMDLAEERGARPDLAICSFRYSEILGKKGEVKEARQHLKKADDLFTELGMKWWAAQVRSLESSLTKKT